MKVIVSHPPRRNASLDGLRGVAALLVLIAHASTFAQTLPPWLEPGQMGVRIFFVLSGYLITKILIDAQEHPGWSFWSAYRDFAVRRFLRIVPGAYAVLLVAWWLCFPDMVAHPWWYVAYLGNIHQAQTNAWADGIGHFWSLAVEEQFYAVWPAAVWLTPARWRGRFFWLLVVLAIPSRAVVAHLDVAPWTLTPARIDGLALGAWLALLMPSPLALLLPGVVLAAVPWMPLQETGLVLLCGAGLIIVLATGALRWRPLVAVGTISYGLYLWHMPALQVYGDNVPLAVAVSFVLAVWNWLLIERPVRGLYPALS